MNKKYVIRSISFSEENFLLLENFRKKYGLDRSQAVNFLIRKALEGGDSPEQRKAN